jgi:peptidase M48-like protein
MSGVVSRTLGLSLFALVCLCHPTLTQAQQVQPSETVPATFSEDAAFASRVRSRLIPYTEPVSLQYPRGNEVFQWLLKQLPARTRSFSWDVRIAKDAGNVFSSPDGTIFVDQSLAQMLGSRSGLWAAVLSHEISHVIHRDWARRYLFKKALEQGGAFQIMLGDAGAFPSTWVDGHEASFQFARFCQALELQADADGLFLMTSAGFHPDFVPALHHLIEAQPIQSIGKGLDPLHPNWGERDQNLQKLYAGAGSQYDRLWPDRYLSPGGNPPIVVYAGPPRTKRASSGELELQAALRCQNLSGSVEVVLRIISADSQIGSELRQVTGCTSNQTLITFPLPSRELRGANPRRQAEILVLDDNGALLTRSLAPISVR